MARTRIVSDAISILRKVTGKTAANDEQFSDTVMLRYLNDFLQITMPHMMPIVDLQSNYTFTIAQGQTEHPFDAENYVLVNSPVYIDGTETDLTHDQTLFYREYPKTVDNQPTRPRLVLFYGNNLYFAPAPDQAYEVEMQAYKVSDELSNLGSPLEQSYLMRYLAYGAALDLLSDYGDFQTYQMVEPIFEKYRCLVMSRTERMLTQTRAEPNF